MLCFLVLALILRMYSFCGLFRAISFTFLSVFFFFFEISPLKMVPKHSAIQCSCTYIQEKCAVRQGENTCQITFVQAVGHEFNVNESTLVLILNTNTHKIWQCVDRLTRVSQEPNSFLQGAVVCNSLIQFLWRLYQEILTVNNENHLQRERKGKGEQRKES